MSARPRDWSALGRSSDPVDGDPDAVEDESRHYRDVAAEIAAQARRLRRLADPGDALRGDYTAQLQEACEELADHMERAHGRFETVGRELGNLHQPMRDAQRETLDALHDAHDAERRAAAEEAKGFTTLDRIDPENSEARDSHRAAEQAGSDLDAARGRCDRAVEAYDETAGRIADAIRRASDDDMKDGRFEGFKAWVKANADVLREISKWLGRIVIVLSIAIILISNPAGWLVIAAFTAAALLLAVDAALAYAGEGSWADVAFDVVGVLSFGVGSLAGKLVKAGRSLTMLRAGHGEGITAAAASLRAAFNGSGTFARVTNVFNRVRPSTYTNALREYTRTMRAVRSIPVVDAGFGAAFRYPFSRDAASLTDDLAAIVGRFGPDVVNPIHRLGLGAMRHASGIGAINMTIDGILDEAKNVTARMPVVTPVLDGIDEVDRLLDRLTTAEVDPLW